MKLSDIMSAAGLTSWAEVGLIISFLTFATIVAYVFVIRSKTSYEEVRQLPLEDGEGCQVRSSAVARSCETTDPPLGPKGNCGTADLAPPEVSS
jgi:hypothetical protein